MIESGLAQVGPTNYCSASVTGLSHRDAARWGNGRTTAVTCPQVALPLRSASSSIYGPK